MKERPILFSALMVQAILAGRKSQTRRIMKHPRKEYQNNITYSGSFGEDINGDWIGWTGKYLPDEVKKMNNELYPNGGGIKCPYGKVGDVLWVRETWQRIEGNRIIYKADPIIWGKKWKPSIFMPKKACRIKLEITNIRVERLNDISKADVIAEGIQVPLNSTGIGMYAQLWEKINGEGSWDKNPWVWCISFKTI